MAIRSLVAACAALALAAPAAATVVSWRATGSVQYTTGNASLLPISGTPGEDFVLEFSYDDAGVDSDPSPDHGRYPILSLVVTVGGDSYTFFDGITGEGQIHIQANASNPNLWNVSGCSPCDVSTELDEGRLALFYPPGTFSSDALAPLPDPEAASTVQFLVWSKQPGDEAFLVATLEDVVPAPEPLAGASAATALAALALLGRARRPLSAAARSATAPRAPRR